MTLEKVKEILKDSINSNDGLHNLRHYIDWDSRDNYITLDSTFTIEELEAIIIYMKAYAK